MELESNLTRLIYALLIVTVVFETLLHHYSYGNHYLYHYCYRFGYLLITSRNFSVSSIPTVTFIVICTLTFNFTLTFTINFTFTFTYTFTFTLTFTFYLCLNHNFYFNLYRYLYRYCHIYIYFNIINTVIVFEIENKVSLILYYIFLNITCIYTNLISKSLGLFKNIKKNFIKVFL